MVFAQVPFSLDSYPLTRSDGSTAASRSPALAVADRYSTSSSSAACGLVRCINSAVSNLLGPYIGFLPKLLTAILGSVEFMSSSSMNFVEVTEATGVSMRQPPSFAALTKDAACGFNGAPHRGCSSDVPRYGRAPAARPSARQKNRAPLRSTVGHWSAHSPFF